MKIKAILYGSMIVACSSVFADSAQPKVTIQQALSNAQQAGFTDIRKIEFDDGVWEVKGRDAQGRDLEVKINGTTGALTKDLD